MNAFNSNSYCKDAGKAVINYRSYSEGKIRYRYPNQNWQEINGDNYELEETKKSNTIEFPWYFITCEATVNGRFPSTESRPIIFANGQTVKGKTNASFSGVDLSSVIGNYDSAFVRANFNYVQGSSFNATERVEDTNCFYRNINWNVNCDEEEFNQVFYNRKSTSASLGVTNLRNFGLVEDVSQTHRTCSPSTDKCVFKVYHCDELVHEQTSQYCPEIEQIEPELGEEKSITVSPISKNHYIEVNNFAYSISSGTSKSASKISIPPHCLNIYKVDGTFFNPVAKSNNDEHPLKLIAQVCSAKCSPPPQIDVTCFPPEECPPNTCEVQCGNHVCCYNSDGISVFSFPK